MPGGAGGWASGLAGGRRPVEQRKFPTSCILYSTSYEDFKGGGGSQLNGDSHQLTLSMLTLVAGGFAIQQQRRQQIDLFTLLYFLTLLYFTLLY
jgi:hypothetical protein